MQDQAWDRSFLEAEGAWRFSGAGIAAMPALERLSERLPRESAGVRITGDPGLSSLLATGGPIGLVAARTMGAPGRPVRAIIFDKSTQANWSLGWHQDRTICVRKHIEVDGFGPWTMKQGLLHVAPPFYLIARMITLRVHLDDVPIDNAPLLIAPGSHRCGRIAEGEIKQVVRRSGECWCLAGAGDIWAYATPIVHASKAAAVPGRRRRVLQIDYSRDDLPGGLEWLGI